MKYFLLCLIYSELTDSKNFRTLVKSLLLHEYIPRFSYFRVISLD